MNYLVGDTSTSSSKSMQKRYERITEPSRVILLADALNCSRRLDLYGPDRGLDARHKNNVNVLHLDGHVNSVPLQNLTTGVTGDIRVNHPWGWPGWSLN